MNLHLIDRGLAWRYKRYQNEQTPSDRAAYAQAEDAARASRRGLWSDPEPVPPWEWRRR
jgi:endonuclease YncB( thermonuclease family)